MQEALADELPQARWTDPQGGFFLWLTLPEEVDTERLFEAALAEGVAYIPGPAFSIGGRFGERAAAGVQRRAAGSGARRGTKAEAGDRKGGRTMRCAWMARRGCWRWRLAWPAAAATTAETAASGGGGGGKNITIYSSLPLQGAARPQSAKLVNGIKLALDQAGGKAGRLQGDLQVARRLDAAGRRRGRRRRPRRTPARPPPDKSAVAYIGEFNSGATAVSLPLLNDGGMAMVSPANSAVGLTQSGPGAEPGEPDKYYPSGERTFARIVPTDLMQGAGMAQVMKDRGCTAAWISNDKEVYGAGLAKNIQRAADSIGLKIAGNEGFDSKAPELPLAGARR